MGKCLDIHPVASQTFCDREILIAVQKKEDSLHYCDCFVAIICTVRPACPVVVVVVVVVVRYNWSDSFCVTFLSLSHTKTSFVLNRVQSSCSGNSYLVTVIYLCFLREWYPFCAMKHIVQDINFVSLFILHFLDDPLLYIIYNTS